MTEPPTLYTRAAPFVWAAGLALLAVMASGFPVPAVAWYGVTVFGLLSAAAVARGLWALGRKGRAALGAPSSRAGAMLAGAAVPSVGGWFAAMAGFAPCPPALRWVGGALFATVAGVGLLLWIIAPRTLANPLVEHLHDPLGLAGRGT